MDLFLTTTKVKTQQVAHNRSQRCRDIEVGDFLTYVAGPVNLVMDLRIAHERWGSTSNRVINGNYTLTTFG